MLLLPSIAKPSGRGGLETLITRLGTKVANLRMSCGEGRWQQRHQRYALGQKLLDDELLLRGRLPGASWGSVRRSVAALMAYLEHRAWARAARHAAAARAAEPALILQAEFSVGDRPALSATEKQALRAVLANIASEREATIGGLIIQYLRFYGLDATEARSVAPLLREMGLALSTGEVIDWLDELAGEP